MFVCQNIQENLCNQQFRLEQLKYFSACFFAGNRGGRPRRERERAQQEACQAGGGGERFAGEDRKARSDSTRFDTCLRCTDESFLFLLSPSPQMVSQSVPMFRELFSLDKLWNSPPFSFLPMSYTVKGFKIRQKGSFVNMAANKGGNCYYLFQKKVLPREKSRCYFWLRPHVEFPTSGFSQQGGGGPFHKSNKLATARECHLCPGPAVVGRRRHIYQPCNLAHYPAID